MRDNNQNDIIGFKPFDIFNPEKREVLCISTSPNVEGGEGGIGLILYKLYHAYNVIANDWHTEVEIEEFPGVRFNSVLFADKEYANEQNGHN